MKIAAPSFYSSSKVHESGTVRKPAFGMALTQGLQAEVSEDRMDFVAERVAKRFAEEKLRESFPNTVGQHWQDDAEHSTAALARVIDKVASSWTQAEQQFSPKIRNSKAFDAEFGKFANSFLEFLRQNSRGRQRENYLEFLAIEVIARKDEIPDAFARPILEAAGWVPPKDAPSTGATFNRWTSRNS